MCYMSATVNYDAILMELYRKQSETKGGDAYLHAHSRNAAVIRRQTSIFERLQPYFEHGRTMLDWGCRQAADACMMRALRGADVELHGCDVDPAAYDVFFQHAGLHYRQLEHWYLLPYADNTFDTVMGSGVLEHVPNDSASLTELYRVIKPNGYLIITMLPNRISYTEWLNRRLKNPHHLRRYSMRAIREMLLHHGFLPVEYSYHQILPTLSSPKGGVLDSPVFNRAVEMMFARNGVAERVPLLNWFSTNIYIVAKKVEAIHG